METPTARLEAKLTVQKCKVCLWLSSLDARSRREWVRAIANPRFPSTLVAAEIRADGGDVSEGSVQNHRQRAHR